MNGAADIPALAAIAIAALLVIGAAITLVGSLGLLRLRSFYERVHAPTLGTTLGTACIVAASMICFTTLQSRPVVHELLITVFLVFTAPITAIVLMQAAIKRTKRPRD